MSGLVHIYCGDGKGKTSAAIGLSIRAAGAGMRVLFVQFLKSKTSSELSILEQIKGMEVICTKKSEKFTWNMNELEKAKLKCEQEQALKDITDMLQSGKYDLLVLDEAINAVNSDTLSEDCLLRFIVNRPVDLELVLTGRNPCKKLKSCADYISEIKAVRHPYENGIKARKGIEF